MFMVKNCKIPRVWSNSQHVINPQTVTKYLFGDGSKETIIDIPQGQLYIVRPLSPKGYSELIYKDAVATIRRTGQDFHYQLVVQRAYEEGEEELGEEEPEADAIDQDEKTFLLDEALHLRSDSREGSEHVFAWRDLSGDPGDLYEFVCDPAISAEKAQTFLLAAIECQYERKYRKKAEFATDKELQEFQFDQEESIPRTGSISEERGPTSKESADHMAKEVKSSKKKAIMPANTAVQRTGPPAAQKAPTEGEVITKKAGELHLFDFETGSFNPVDEHVTASVSDLGKWQYWLQISSTSGEERLGQEVTADMSPVFNFEYLSFIWNHYTEDGSAYSWLLRFKDRETLEDFQEGLMQALWEQLNEQKWAKVKDQAEKDYVFEAFNDLTMDDAPPTEEEEESEEEEDDERPRSEHYDSDESEEDVETRDKDGNINSQLAVGAKNDRSYVIRGSKIGVFKHLPNKHLEFTTNINKIETPKGKLFSPKKVMLHAEDQNMVLQDETNPNALYRMDLEYGKIVDEWKVHDDIPVLGFGPESKFAQATGNQPFVGHSHNALFRVDPRVSGSKLVESDMKQYASKNDFSAQATTEKGYLAVASNKGDIRLFDRLGVNAKTQVPALGDPIIGIDVSADGRWVLGTCVNYLLLIDTLQTEGRYEGKLGFERSFAKDSKPKPRRLQPSPEHIAQIRHVTGAPIKFTQAKFNVSQDGKETSIITSTGPYLVTWNMKKVLAGTKDPYNIKKYGEEVMADNFEYGSDKNVILALPNEVDMVSRKSFKKPTRESIAGPGSRLSAGGVPQTPRRGGRMSKLREEIVNSPY
jgi:hypothetical protein